jgi:carbon monoxide dehydrogenase subunit G
MIVNGQTQVALGREELWAALCDPARLAEALPGAGEVSVSDERHFSAVAHPLTALGETRVSMEFTISEQPPSEHVRIHGSGSAGENLIELSIALDLSGEEDTTSVSWRADLALRGVLASLLQRGAGELLREQVEAVLAAGARSGGSARAN